MNFIITTTNNIEGYKIEKYIAIVTGEAILGVNFIKDWVAGLKDTFGGRIYDYEEELRKGRKKVISQLVDRAISEGANALVGIRFDHEVLSPKGKGTSLMIMATGTAVFVSPAHQKSEAFAFGQGVSG
ncbi:MAG: YbjQ family protein [Nitrospirae bacterium]|nr:YbjQ family protein [Nitrospirota bacterium]